MTTRPARQIAILVETNDSWGREFVAGVAQWTPIHGPWILLIEPRDRQGRLCLPEGWSGDGVIARLSTPTMVEQVRKAGKPVVDVDIVVPTQPWMARVLTDDRQRGRLALAHLLDRGFQRFAWFAPPSPRYAARRGDPFRAAVKAAGFECAVFWPEDRRQRKIGWREQQQLVVRWLESLAKPLAVFAADAHCGRQLAEFCQHSGVSVPDQVAILAGDTDELMCRVCAPPLSSVLLGARRIGCEAAALLDRLMRGGRIPRKPILVEPIGVIARQSTDVLAIPDEEIVQAIRFMRADACRKIQVDDVLRAVPISRRSLELRCLQYLGRSPAEEIRRVRLETAARLLTQSDLSIEEVAQASGFAGATRLGVAFRKTFGRTPLSYRKQFRLRTTEAESHSSGGWKRVMNES